MQVLKSGELHCKTDCLAKQRVITKVLKLILGDDWYFSKNRFKTDTKDSSSLQWWIQFPQGKIPAALGNPLHGSSSFIPLHKLNTLRLQLLRLFS